MDNLIIMWHYNPILNCETPFVKSSSGYIKILAELTDRIHATR